MEVVTAQVPDRQCGDRHIVLELCARQREAYEYGFNDSALLASSLCPLSQTRRHHL